VAPSPPRLFGTDGVRGVAGSWPLDPPTISRLGGAIVRGLDFKHRARLVVGRDTRESGEWIEREFARGAAAQGAEVVSAGVVPTPLIAYLARTLDFDLGVVISASHNPYRDNGIKVFSGQGEKFGESEERDVEQVMADTSWSIDGAAEARLERRNLLDLYVGHVHQLFAGAPSPAGTPVAIDMANGATTSTAPTVLRDLGLRVVTLGDVPNGRNINMGCGSTHPAQLSSRSPC
jgi:phosphoglucosamine mutase